MNTSIGRVDCEMHILNLFPSTLQCAELVYIGCLLCRLFGKDLYLFENIELSGAMVPIFIRGGTREGRHNAVLPGDRHILRRITMRNIRGEAAAWTASSVSGVDGCRVADVTLENIDIVCRGAGADKSSEALRRPVPDVSKCYPEATMFRHILPAYGLYADKVDGLCLRDVRFRLRDGDVDMRPAVVRTKDTTCAEGTRESLRLPTGACITRDRIVGEGGGGSYAPNTLKAYREALDSGFSCTFNLFRSADGEVYATDAMDLYASLRIKSAATNMNWMVGMLRWAACAWPRAPLWDITEPHYEPGETFFLYPGARASTRCIGRWRLRSGTSPCHKERL